MSLGNSTQKEKSRWLWLETAYSMKIFKGMTLWVMTHMPLSRITRVEAKTNDHLGITSQEADPSLKGKKCNHYGKIGHMKRNCKIMKQRVDKSQKQREDKNTTAKTCISDNEVTLLCNQEDYCHVVEQDVEWVVGSTTSYHCIPKREYFSTDKARDFGIMKMGNKSVSQIAGIGDICIQTSMGCTLTLKDVRHIPDLRLNLVSVHMLDKDGYNHFIDSGNWKLTKRSLVVV